MSEAANTTVTETNQTAENSGGDPKGNADNAAAVSTPDPAQAKKTFTQKELDDIVKQRLDRAKKDMGSIRDNGAVVEAPLSNFDLAASDVMAKVEAAGYDVDGFAAKIGVKNSLRKLRDASGAPIFVSGTDQNELYGQPIEFVRNGAWRDDQAEIIAGEWKYSLVGTHGDISYEILKEATLQNTLDEDGKPLSLAEQDMVAIKVTMLIAYLCVKPEAFAALAPTNAEVHDTTLSTLTVGSLTLSPEFKSAIAAYTATTTNARPLFRGYCPKPYRYFL